MTMPLTTKPEVVYGIKAAPIDAITHPEWPSECRKAIAPYMFANQMHQALRGLVDAFDGTNHSAVEYAREVLAKIDNA